MRGNGLGKAIKRIGEEQAAIRADVTSLLLLLPRLRGPKLRAVKALVEEYLPEKATWLRRRPPIVRKTSQDYFAHSEHLKSTAQIWRQRGHHDKANECEIDAAKAMERGRRRKSQGH